MIELKQANSTTRSLYGEANTREVSWGQLSCYQATTRWTPTRKVPSITRVVSVGSDFVVTNNCVREFTTNSLDMDTRRTVKTNNTMLPSTPISTSTSWTTPSPHPTTQTWSPTESTPTTRLPPTSTSWTTPSSRSTPRTWIPAEPSKPPLTMRQSTLRIGYRWGCQCHRLRDPRRHGQRRVPNQL